MIRSLTLATIIAAGLAFSSVAEEAKVKIEPGNGQTDSNSILKAPATETVAQLGPRLTLSDDDARIWINKPIYSSDGKNVGEVAAFQRDADNNVIGMHADIGGFLGMGQTRVSVTPAQFKLSGDRILLDLTAAQSKELPKVQI